MRNAMIFFSLLVLLPACDGNGKTEDDATEDARPETQPDLQPDVIPDTQPDEVEDPAVDDGPPVQGPVTFVVRNVSSTTLYLDWQVFGGDLISGGRTTGGAWAPVSYWQPYCMEACADHGPATDCCIACLPPPSVREFPAGQEVRMEWDGAGVFETDSAYCVCPCYRPAEVIPMGYRAEACVYYTYNCWAEPCTPDDAGIMDNANVTGDPGCFETTFDIPYEGTEVVIEVQ
jgi:hypothetical protein